nr:MAG TPA: ATP synthase subunit alpha [Caudoviricetes sp.]
MSCYNELIDRLRSKNVPKAETDSLMEWGFSALEKADPKTYEEIMHKMEGLAYSISQQEAESIVKAMKPSGEKWPIRDIHDVMRAHGVSGDPTEWYLVMNMAWNDYKSTGDKFGAGNDTDFYFCIAKDFITDADAKPYKVAKYFAK